VILGVKDQVRVITAELISFNVILQYR